MDRKPFRELPLPSADKSGSQERGQWIYLRQHMVMNMTPEIHPELQDLQQRAERLVYPEVMMSATAAIPGPGFFPGAWGTWAPASAISGRPIMVLGQDQDRVSGMAQSIRTGNELYSPTWKNLQALFAVAGVPLAACFFTNFIMGVRHSSDRNTGPSPALAYPAFMRACADLFLVQLRTQQPRVIITLGMVPFQLLQLVSTDLRYRALGITEFDALDARGAHLFANVTFDDAAHTSATVLPICHPCQPQNGRRRSFSTSSLYSDEATLLKHVLGTIVPATIAG